jgi:hypothetical protein
MKSLPRAKHNPPKVMAHSKDRYRASAEERRRYGGNVVTEFYVMWPEDHDDPSRWEVITGYGKTAADRKRDAISKFIAKHPHGQQWMKRENPSSKKRRKPQRFYDVKVINPGEPPHPNPSVRYTAVPVDADGDGDDELAYIVRGGRKKDAIRKVASKVDADAWIDLDRTRTFPTKHHAEAHGRRVASRIEALYERVARGGD